MANSFPTETDFLKSLIVSKFNEQFSTSYLLTDFNIYSIAPKPTQQIGYELTSTQLNNPLKLRAYFNFATNDEVSTFTLGLLPTASLGTLDDEVYVCYGLIDQYYLDENIYNFSFIDNPLDFTSFIVDDDGNILSDDNENFIIYYG